MRNWTFYFFRYLELLAIEPSHVPMCDASPLSSISLSGPYHLEGPANASLEIPRHHNRKVLPQALQETGTNPRERRGNAHQTSQALLER